MSTMTFKYKGQEVEADVDLNEMMVESALYLESEQPLTEEELDDLANIHGDKIGMAAAERAACDRYDRWKGSR